jgi:uncharacterized protein (TIGR00297 family)
VIGILALGAALGGLLAWVGHRARLLSGGGAVIVFLGMVLTSVTGGWVWSLSLLVTLVSIGLWARFRRHFKRTIGERFQEKSQRGWLQALSRIGWPVALALLYGLLAPERSFFVAYIGALAAVTADAWGTELGVLSNQQPRLLISRIRVPAGTAGGISTLGLIAGVGASWLIGFTGLLLTALRGWIEQLAIDPALLWLPVAAMIGGVAGSLTDSLLGATAQGITYCEHCKERSEYRVHSCGRSTQPVRGWAWLTNEGVNVVCSLVGAAVTAGAVTWLARFSGQW